MKIVICTTPIRPVPTSYPPFGSLAVIQALRAAGYDPIFYDIDGLRPSLEEVEAFFKRTRPDVVGISAVVSTAYAYTKNLARLIRRAAPLARVVVGGNLAASAEILHRLAGIDVCVAGEGEIVAVNLLRAMGRSSGRMDPEALQAVRGITYLRPDGEMAFTGYEAKLPAEEVFNPDFEILERYSKIENFITDPFDRPDFSQDPRTSQPHRRGKKQATLVTAKGCVARCTFCHRWDKGYRAIPVRQILDKVRLLQSRYNVGFINFSDENFGSDRRQTEELVAGLAPLDVLWQVGGVRVRSVDPALLKAMKEAGCVAVYYGMETGSPAILQVMEKNATLRNNLDAARWTAEAGLYTIFQMVLGMPGESGETIAETTDFLKTVTQDLGESPRSRMSINYIQALPGTPVYEFARAKGFIGRSLVDEERYLLSISDINAADDTKMLNFTGSDYLSVRSWRRTVVLDVMRHYHRHRGTPAPSWPALGRLALQKALGRAGSGAAGTDDYQRGGYFNLSRDLGYDVIVAYFYRARHLVLALWLLQDEYRRLGAREMARHIGDWLKGRLWRGAREPFPEMSLRKIMTPLAPPPATASELSMQPLRDGR